MKHEPWWSKGHFSQIGVLEEAGEQDWAVNSPVSMNQVIANLEAGLVSVILKAVLLSVHLCVWPSRTAAFLCHTYGQGGCQGNRTEAA